MAVKSPFARKVLGLLGAFGMRWWRSTIDWKIVYADATSDPVHPHFAQRGIYACWHEVLLMPILLRAHHNNLALASEHGDGDIISRAMQHLGWSMVRGSSTRGGTTALLKMLRDDSRNLSFTPDGPRGPRRTMSPGPIFLASKLGIPIVCVGYAFDRPWRLRSWDRFAIPKPYSRGRAVFGPPLRVPGRLGRDDAEAYRAWFEQLLNWLTEEAEAWAASGRRRQGELPMLPGAPAPRLLQWDPSSAVRIPDRLHESWMRLGNAPIGAQPMTKLKRPAA